MNYENKLAFITGGSTGIGLAIATALAIEKCTVVLFARDTVKLKQAKEAIQNKVSSSVHIFSADMSDYSAAKLVLEEAVAQIGIPDILVNCVGIARPDYFENISPKQFDFTIKTNLYSMWNSNSILVPYMKKRGGHIINTSSIAGFIGVFGYTDYSMTKFGIIGFSEALRSELKKYKITVQVLCPPDTDTPGFEEENINKPEETKAIGGKAKLMQPETVAKEVLQKLGKNTFMLLPGFDGKMSWRLKRFFPKLIEWIMDNSINKVKK